MSILPGFLNPILSEIESNGFAYLSMNNRSFKVEKEGIEERRNLDMVSVLNKIQSKVIILFGNKDQFTPPSDAYRLRDLLGDRCVKFLMIEEADHFFMTTQEELLTKVHDALVEVTSPRV
jgi:alpha/beta superfamily hydrolase